MRIVLTIIHPSTDDADPLSFDVAPSTTVGTLKDHVQTGTRIAASAQYIWHNGQVLDDDAKTLEQLEITEGEMLSVHVREATHPSAAGAERRRQARATTSSSGNQRVDYETQRLSILGNPQLRQQLKARSPELDAVLDDPQRFADVMARLHAEEQTEMARRRQELADLNADPFDIDAQMRIQEMIREERVQENLQNAIEHTPEVFGRVHMLYIDVEVNGHKIKAFVDSGAQATIMSPSCAETCNIMRLVDKRFAGMAKGVGTATILGRVHSAQIRIGNIFLPCSFTVMEGKDVDLLLGLDMLKRHQACIDLAQNRLMIQGVEVSFLGEADIPRNMEEERAEEPVVPGPGGTTIGAKSGAVSAPGERIATTSETSQPTAPSVPTAPSAMASRPEFPPETIEQLVALGFSQEEAYNALVACGGNVEYAAGLLFQG